MSVRTAYKWLHPFGNEGVAGLLDRTSRLRASPRATPDLVVKEMISLRRERRTYREIALRLWCATSTVARRLANAGHARLPELESAPPVVRYEAENPGDLLHLDIRKLGRFQRPGHRVTGDRTTSSDGAGWEYVHVAIDDHSRVAFSSILLDETACSACRALVAAIRYYRALGVRFTRLLTDNGSAYRSRAFARLVRRLGLRHRFTRPYTPRTNGNAERLIQTAVREWAYARSYASSGHRAAQLPQWLHHYNWHRTPWQPRLRTTHHAPAHSTEQRIRSTRLADSVGAVGASSCPSAQSLRRHLT